MAAGELGWGGRRGWPGVLVFVLAFARPRVPFIPVAGVINPVYTPVVAGIAWGLHTVRGVQ